MTVAELEFLQTVPKVLKDISRELKEINSKLEGVAYEYPAPSSVKE